MNRSRRRFLQGSVLAAASLAARPTSTFARSRRERIAIIYGSGFDPLPLRPTATPLSRSYLIRRQGNDSNCDYLVAANGVQAIGGDGERAYWHSRELVRQRERDFREFFYTRSSSDQPFSIENVGAAPEAFVGVYEALGYDAVMLAAPAGSRDDHFTRAVHQRLAEQPDHSFAHLWITPYGFNPSARQLAVPETGEQASILYPYHEVVGLVAADQPDQIVILDSLVGYPFAMDLPRLAQQLRGFNRGIVVSQSSAQLIDHHRLQLSQVGQPYVAPTLGGIFLHTARQLWGASYGTWGGVLNQPVRTQSGDPATVMLPGEYVHYVREGAGDVGLIALGLRMAYDLIARGVLPPDSLRSDPATALAPGVQAWATEQFGSVADFERAFGKPIAAEVWLSPDQMYEHVLRGVSYPGLERDSASGYVVTLTERAVIAWSAEHGTVITPLGRVFYDQLLLDTGLW